MRLTVLAVRKLVTPGRYADGNGLYLQVRGPERRSWIFRYVRHGRARWMGLGSLEEVSLAEARQGADSARRLLRDGRDPLAEREAQRSAPIARTLTFSEVGQA